MAIGADYITRADLKAYMSLELTTYDALVDTAISSASREIERYTKRQFNNETAATARRYHPVRCGLVLVDDFYSTTGLVVKTDDNSDGVFETTWTLGVDFDVEPLNGIMDGTPGWPYTKLVAIGSRSFPGGTGARIEVTAKWGWAAVPAQVVEACKMIASDGFQYKDTRMGVAGADQFGTLMRVKDNGMAASKLRPFRRGRVMVR